MSSAETSQQAADNDENRAKVGVDVPADDHAELLSKVDGAVKSRFLMRVGWIIIVHVYFTRPTDWGIV